MAFILNIHHVAVCTVRSTWFVTVIATAPAIQVSSTTAVQLFDSQYTTIIVIRKLILNLYQIKSFKTKIILHQLGNHD